MKENSETKKKVNEVKTDQQVKEDTMDPGELRAEWYFKGRKSVFSKNKSGCCCIFDKSDVIISVCAAHKELLANALKG